jgi:hypothetical protein
MPDGAKAQRRCSEANANLMGDDMKFRFYITDLFDGNIKGTDDESTAANYAGSADFFIVDTETGEWLTENGGRQEIESA